MVHAPLSRPPIGRSPARNMPDATAKAAKAAKAPATRQRTAANDSGLTLVPVSRSGGIDETDILILRLLQSDGRISNLKLAALVGLRPGAARERVKRLTREGYILGYEARLNPVKLSAGMLVLTKVRLEHMGLALADAFRAAVQVRPEILECHEVAGDFDYLIKTRATDIRAYSSMLASLIWSLPGVRDTRSYAVMEEVKNTTHVPL
jgi:Lrp/AsnC family leucine-responsive transcriptional regulator